MITFKPVVAAHQKRADGTYNIKIRVTFKRSSRWLPTTLTCSQNDLTRTLHIKSAGLRNKCDALVSRMRAAAGEISPFLLEEKDVDFVVKYIKAALGEESFRLDFFEWAEKCMDGKAASTRKVYRRALDLFARYLGGRELDVNAITKSMVKGFVDYVDALPDERGIRKDGTPGPKAREKRKGVTSSIFIYKLSHIFDMAKERYNDEDSGRVLISRSPFSGVRVSIPPAENGQKSLGFDLMQRVILSTADSWRERAALDAFVVSFALMGANLADLYEAETFEGGRWVYYRRKTRNTRADRAEIRVDVPECTAPFLDRLRGDSAGRFWLGKLHFWKESTAGAAVDHYLSLWCRKNGVPEFSFYAARKTWASLAWSMAGIDKATIDEGLGHVGSYRMADVYIEKDWSVVNRANAKVLALFRWE